MNSLDLSRADAELGVLLLVATATFLAYHYLGPARGRRDAAFVLRRRVLGGALLGAVPLAVAVLALGLTPRQVGVAVPAPGASLGVAFGLWVLLLPLLALSTRASPRGEGSGDQRTAPPYPEILAPRWSWRLRLESAGAWALYLAGYELFFRGVLLFVLAERIGAWPAIFVTTALYAFAHLPKDAGECAGSIGFGVALGAMTLWSGSVLPAGLLHVLIAVSAETLAIRTQPRPAPCRSRP